MRAGALRPSGSVWLATPGREDAAMHGRRRRGRGELKGSGPTRQWPEHLPGSWLIWAASFAQCKGRDFSEPTVDFTRDSTFHEAELRRVMRPMPAKSSLSEVCVRIAGWLPNFEVI